MNSTLRAIDFVVGFCLMVFAFFAVGTGVTKDPAVMALTLLLFYGGARLMARRKGL